MFSQENPLRISWASTGIPGSSVAQLVGKDTVHMGSRWFKSLEPCVPVPSCPSVVGTTVGQAAKLCQQFSTTISLWKPKSSGIGRTSRVSELTRTKVGRPCL